MSQSARAVTLVGATGLTGTAALNALLSSSSPFSITTLTRKAISQQASKTSTLDCKVIPDLSQILKGQVGSPEGVYISCLGTTQAAAGGIKQQEAIDLHLNRDLFTKAKDDGAETVCELSIPRPSLVIQTEKTLR